MFILRFFATFILLSLLYSISLHSQTAQEYYNQGLELKKQNQIDEAIKVFEKATGKDRNFSEAYYEIALLYQSKQTPGSLKRAETALLEACRIDTKNVKYKNALGKVYLDRGMFEESKTMYKRALAINPDDTTALAEMAIILADEVNRYKYRVDNVPRYYFYDPNILEYKRHYTGSMMDIKTLEGAKRIGIMPPIRWEEHVAMNDSTSRAYNDKILTLNPFDREALYRQGLLYFDKVVYQSSYGSSHFYDGFRPDTSYIDEFAKLFEELVRNHPDDKDGHLFLGLAYHRMHEYEKAYEYYNTARSLMSEDERAVFSNVGYLSAGGIKEKNIIIAESADSNFWYQRDPLYLTPYNERELEHYSRVAEANLRFFKPDQGIEGWQTDRGKMLIKYGLPKNRVQYGFPFTKDYWHYDNFAYVFERLGWDINGVFVLTVWDNMDFRKIVTDIEKNYPEFYEYEPKGKIIDFYLDAADFRGDEGETRVEFYYGIPFNRLRFDEEGEYYYGNFRTGVFLHDQDWNRILEDVQDKDLQFSAVSIDTLYKSLGVDKFEYQVKPGKYNYAFEIMDWYSDNAGTLHDTIDVEEYGYNTLQISDIQVAWDITMLNPDTLIFRDNLDIDPNPRRIYLMDESIYIYYEIYNLLLDGFPGGSDYTVEYKLQYLEKDKPWIVDFVRKLVINSKQDKGVATSFNVRGRERNESAFLRIDHKIKKTGQYRLTLKITDNIVEKSVEKSADFHLFENK
ncbi:hypothetical protein AMJ80_01005 [bacterium SM23_31]|nr:MAG: hypothetical protein AMJ80_01005 [bacterium SM23_31]